MKKSMKFLALFLLGVAFALPSQAFAADDAAKTKNAMAKKSAEPTTRPDAVIFKIHDIDPVLEEGVVKGCNYMITLYNRTSINFRTFTINLSWNDEVDERFKFDRYVETLLGVEEADKQRSLFSKVDPIKPVQTSVTVNAFGADKQISLRSYMDNEKCYLMLSNAQFSVTPCDIARTMDTVGSFGVSTEQSSCTELFQFVSPKNPEYFGEFKRISATEEAAESESAESRELSDIDMIIGKIVENMGTSDKTLTNIY